MKKNVKAGETIGYAPRLHSTKAIKAYEALDLEKPYPLIRIVKPGHKGLGSRSALATATVEEDGKEVVYFNRYWIASGKPMGGVVMHEYAHFKTWRRFGHDVQPHGREFWGVCVVVTARSNCTTYEGRFG